MRMKKTILYFVLAALLCSSCARIAQTGLNDANKRFLDAWIQVNHPGARQTELGSYILEDIPAAVITAPVCMLLPAFKKNNGLLFSNAMKLF